MATALETARRRQQEDIARLSLSVPRADDPELAEHALWNDMLAADAEHSQFADARYAAVPPDIRPRTESLKDVTARLLP